MDIFYISFLVVCVHVCVYIYRAKVRHWFSNKDDGAYYSFLIANIFLIWMALTTA